MGGHALLSPSGASRWLECPPSARLEASKPDKAGDAADEGTLAHNLSEVLLEYELQRITKTVYKQKIKAIEANQFYTDSMFEYCEQFKVFVMQQFNEAQTHTKDALILLEQQIDLTDYIPEGFGTGDVIIIANDILIIIDLKYGKGVRVDATNNKQMMLYGLGAYVKWNMLYDVEVVQMTIYQPRIDNFSTWSIKATELIEWADAVLIPKAKDAWEGKGEFNPGVHCQFCRVKTTCKANADFQMQLAIHEFEDPKELDEDALVDIFNRAASFKNWINAVEDMMFKAALNENKKWPGLKLVQGRSNRTITDPVKVISILKKNKINETDYMTVPKLLGITGLEKNIGAKEFNKLAGKYVLKPEGKPALVNAADSRAEYHSNDAAAKEFAESDGE